MEKDLKMTSAKKHILDILWAKTIIKRDPICRICGQNRSSDAAHVVVRNKSLWVRWYLLNGLGLCRTCHRWQHDNPELGRVAFSEIIGKSKYDKMVSMGNDGKKHYVRFEYVMKYLETGREYLL